MSSEIKALLFDLDGTLIESFEDIATATNQLLALYGHKALPRDDIRLMVGNGVRKLVERSFRASGHDLSTEELDARAEAMVDIYNQNLTNFTTLLPGAREIIEQYHGRGVRLAVVTNKSAHSTRLILDYFGLSEYFGAVVGGDSLPTRKPAPEMLWHALTELGVSRGEAVMIGDSPPDVEAAQNAGLRSVVLRGGYSRVDVDTLGAARVIDNLHELPAALAEI